MLPPLVPVVQRCSCGKPTNDLATKHSAIFLTHNQKSADTLSVKPPGLQATLATQFQALDIIKAHLVSDATANQRSFNFR